MGRTIFPSYFLAGFECSTFIWKDGNRRDYVQITGHDRHLEQDYQRVRDLGMAGVRESIRWPLVDRGGNYDWSTVDPVLEALDKCGLTPIWDLCHYGWPDGIHPLEDGVIERFAEYCHACAERVGSMAGFFTPVNEISFTSGAATDMAWFYPFLKGRYVEMKDALCSMAIQGAKAIRTVSPEARMVHVDPIIHEVPPPDRPDLADEAWDSAYDKAYEAWDILYGSLKPELGGSPEILDIVGVNVYNFSQSQMNADGTKEILGPCDPRRKPLSELLQYAWDRYHRPIIIGETSGHQEHRDAWLRDTMEESMRALSAGIDLQAVCLYPGVDIPDWQSGEWAKIGIYDVKDRESCERIPCEPYISELRRWQKLLDQPEHLDGDVGEIDLEEVRRHAQKREAAGGGAASLI
jgi:beta-glucosidase/6-phospho-beta-glucosidase/beta-galactosidase